MSEATARESKAPTESEIAGSKAAAPVHPVLKGVHHTARPTWKLRETVEFYRDKLGLPIVHAISARGWGPSNHPDFLHFFFNSGKGSTIAFFYYIGADQPEYTKPLEDYRSRASHTAWQVDSLDELLEWRTRLEQQGIALRYQIRHELIESIYFADPNGYPIEITYEVRPMNRLDSRDAEETLEAAMQREDAEKQQGERFVSVDQVWRGKASNRARSSPLGSGSGKDGDDIAGGEAVLYILDVPEFEPLVKAAKASDAYRLTGPDNGYWRVSSKEALVFERKALGFVPALWNGALTGGYAGEIEAFNRDRLEIRPAGEQAMKIAIVGGGPSGLYLALLLLRQRPEWDVHVVEQNAPDATFGFGVVMADTGLMQLRDADADSYEAISSAMYFNYKQIIVQRETPIEVLRNVKGGAIARLTLLRIMQKLCEDAGTQIHYGERIAEVADLERLGLADADVVVGADGINSVVRSEFAAGFGTTQQTLTNHFAWYGTERVFEAPALVFRKRGAGHYVAHYYPYNDKMSTFVGEIDDATWQREKLGELSDDDRQHLFEEIYEPELQGMRLISNKSAWRQFPVIRNAQWSTGRYVLIGDALASAHFSIGSGTRIAMTDSIALAKALLGCDGHVRAGLDAYEAAHRPHKRKLIDASEKSYNWYERYGEWMEKYSPEEFVYQFMTRTGRVDDARLRQEFPALMARLDASRVAAQAGAGA